MSDEQTNQTTDTTNADASSQPPEVTTPASEVGTTVLDPTVATASNAAVASSEQSSGSISSDLGNASAASSSSVADAAPVSLSSASAALTGEDPNVNSQTSPHELTPAQLAQIQAIGNPPAVGLASALSAAAQPENGMQSSANTAQQNVATQGIGASESRAKGALASLQRLREHLWTFERSAVAHLHAELDKLESIFR